MSKRRRQRSDYERIISKYEAGGKAEGQVAFARRHRLSVSALQYWLYKLRGERKSKRRHRPAVEFVEVKPAETEPQRVERVEIELPAGVVVRLGSGASGEEIAEVVRELLVGTARC